MTLKRRAQMRWLVPLLAFVVVMTAGSAVATITRSGHGSLPTRTASRLLVDVQTAKLRGFSGTVVQSAALGLPALPGIAGGQSSDFSSLVSGSHTLRVWSTGPRQTRIALLGQLGESDLVRNGNDVWVWSSHDNTARHLSVPAEHGAAAGESSGGSSGGSASADQPLTPQQAAQAALKAIDPTTRVSTDPNGVVAGRPAYQLVLRPRDTASLIGSVKLAIDAATHVPTRVQVFARGAAKPAFEVGYTSFNPSTPPSSVFRFNPPPGATVTEGMAPESGKHAGIAADQGLAGLAPQLFGQGWTTVVTAKLPAEDGSATTPSGAPGSLDALVKELPVVSGAWGSGHLLRGTLFSALVTDDGRLVAGTVAPDRLYAALTPR